MGRPRENWMLNALASRRDIPWLRASFCMRSVVSAAAFSWPKLHS
jgi:hypothetical protein